MLKESQNTIKKLKEELQSHQNELQNQINICKILNSDWERLEQKSKTDSEILTKS